MAAFYKKELRSYFQNMTGYIFIAILLFFAGIYTQAYCLRSRLPNFELVLYSVTNIFFLLVPILTMRSVADEKAQRTDRLLYSLPVNLAHVVIAKYLAMLTILGLTCAVVSVYPLIISGFGIVDFVASYSTLLGFFLLGAALIAIGMFISSLTESQIIAAVLSFCVTLVLSMMSGLTSLLPTSAAASFWLFIALAALLSVLVGLLTKNVNIALIFAGVCVVPISIFYLVKSEAFEGLFGKIIGYLAVFDRFQNFVYGIFDITAIVYYLSIVVFFVFLTVEALDRKRWA